LVSLREYIPDRHENRPPLRTIREYVYDKPNDKANAPVYQGDGGFKLKLCLDERNTNDDTWTLTIVLQRALVHHPQSILADDIGNLADAAPTFDLKILCGSGEKKGEAAKSLDPTASGGEELRCSRLILAARSPVLYAQFYGPAAGVERQSGTWDLRPTSQGIVKALLGWTYGKRVSEWTANLTSAADALALFELAMRFDMLDLASSAASIFQQRLNDIQTAVQGMHAAKCFADVDGEEVSGKPKDKVPKSEKLQKDMIVDAPFGSRRFAAQILAVYAPQQTVKIRYCMDGVERIVKSEDVVPSRSTYALVVRSLSPADQLASRRTECARLVAKASRTFLRANIDSLVGI
jgi:hypothetical protein